MRKNTLFIIVILLITLCFFQTEKAYTENIKCHPGYVKDGYTCKNQTNSLSYKLYSNKYYLDDIQCGKDCNPDGTNCKEGFCDKKELVNHGFTEIKNNAFYNPITHLSFDAYYNRFYIDDALCGRGCDLNGKNCKGGGFCNKNELINKGFTEIKDNKIYNPKTHLSYNGADFYLDGVDCGYNCDLDGRNCENGGFCDKKEEITNYGYTEVKSKFDYTKVIYNPKTDMAFYWHTPSSTPGYYTSFYLNGARCGKDCKLDGTNCKTGVCDKKVLTSYGYTEVKGKNFYNPQTKMSFEYDDFYIDDIYCGYGCNLDGKNCKTGYCDINLLKQHGYTEKKNRYTGYSNFTHFYYYTPFEGMPEPQNRFYNPKTHIAFHCSGKGGKLFYLDKVLCGFNCDIDGKNCEKGICSVSDCANGYKNMGILTTGNWELDYLAPVKAHTQYVICHNNAKYYNVFEPNIIKSVILKDVEHF